MRKERMQARPRAFGAYHFPVNDSIHSSVMDALGRVPDPEMPISIVDLGLVEDVRVIANGASGATVSIVLLPTFIGCPALDMIAGDVRAKVGELPGIADVSVAWVHDPAWTVDRISNEGRASLAAHGVTVPPRGGGGHLDVPGHAPPNSPQAVTMRISAVPCPFCGSRSTYLDSPFGPTRCRTIYYCESCRNSFEHLKRV